MSASWPGIMRGPRLKTLLVLLLLLLTTLTESVVCQEEEEDNAEPDADAQEEEQTEETGGDDGTTETETVPSPAPDPVDTEGEPVPEDGETQTSGDEDKKHIHGITPISTSPTYSDKPTDEPEGEQDLNIIMILLPVVLVLLIGMILCGIFVRRRWKQKGGNQDLDKEDQYLDGSSTEKVPMPMFEEDVPSVLELEMEELDQWMKKDNGTADDSHHA